MSDETVGLDWVTVGAALLVIGASLVLAGLVLHSGSSSNDTAAAAGSSISASPLPGQRYSIPRAGNPSALTFARRSRDLLLGGAATPGGPVDLLAIPGREPVSLESVTASIGSRLLPIESCGYRCFRLLARVMSGRPTTVVVLVRRRSTPTATITLPFPARLPPSGEQAFRAADRRMKGLRTLVIHETLSSGITSIRSTYLVQAPDRMQLETRQGQRAILIGKRRWDWEQGRWAESPFPGVDAPSYVWAAAGNARDLGRSSVGGVPVRILSVFRAGDPPAWFRLFVDRSGAVLEAEMLTESHFMTHRFTRLNSPIRIGPPT